MRKVYIVFSLLLTLTYFLNCTAKNALNKEQNGATLNEPFKDEFRGVWVCTVYRMDYPSAYTKNNQALKNDIDAIIKNSVECGFNTIIFQVRPAADAFYFSNIFPWSKYLTGTQGQAPDNGFDPLKYIIEKCHLSNLELHAWINPYRITAQTSDNLISSHIALSDSEYTVDYQGKLYFNPGVPIVRKIVIDGVKEIVENYDVDGIHFDDYFYPDKNFNDAEAFFKYNNGFSNIEDWRRNNNDLLINDTYNAIKEINPSVEFGVSPPGIWANKSYNILGSNTNGFQAYYDIFADSLKWVKNNWLDYIVPQVYWHIGNTAANYSVLLDWWADAVNNTNVKLYMGMACYKSDDISYGSVWVGGDEIERQIILNRNKTEVSGMVFFRYLDVIAKPAIRQQAENYFIFNSFIPIEDESNEESGEPQDGDTLDENEATENKNNNSEEKNNESPAFLNKYWKAILFFVIFILFFIFLFIFIKRFKKS